MRMALVLFCVFGIVTGSAPPIPLISGAFTAHFPTGIRCSSSPLAGKWCREYWDRFRIEDRHDQVNPMDTANEVIWFVLAAWDEEKTWCGAEFGLGEYDAADSLIEDHGPCRREDELEIPAASRHGPGEGTAIVAPGAPWEGKFMPVYWLAGYAYEEGLIPLAADPSTDFVGMSDCASLPVSWAVDSLGAWGSSKTGLCVLVWLRGRTWCRSPEHG